MLRNGLEPWHLVVVVLVVFLLFGAKRLPDTARALGKSLRILKSETKALKDDFKEGASGESAAPRTQDEPVRRTIQSAPGDTASARPVEDPRQARND
ncbi:Sec-independent protein translocase subunit TatA [Streptomyces sp. RPT161]|uniref:Sec-independent protein translocase subunit TatA n=1 Tax=Streptomyces sp. RPT161 TaxID=3015993 RepID=UPI0022B8709D|nr:Sec-independent protein translocase subunit TatA [Streptomyces sp. RPT161]